MMIVVVLLVAAGGVVFAVSRGTHQHAATHVAARTPSPTPSPTPSMSFAALYSEDRTGIVKIDSISCTEEDEGTGFVLGPHLIATVAHVVDGSVGLKVTAGTIHSAAHVIGIDDQDDVALLRTTKLLPGHRFAFSSTTPQVGAQLGVIGYPLNGPINFTAGSVSGLGRKITVEGYHRTGLIQTDAAINPGNSGGPLLDSQGAVDGLVDAQLVGAEGFGYAVSAHTASPLLRLWERTPAPPARPPCAQEINTAPSTPPSAPVDVINAYFAAINAQDWRAVWALGGDNLGESYAAMVAGYAHTAHDDAFVYRASGERVSVVLLATETSGVTQIYLGSFTVGDGEIIAASQSLLSTDSGTTAFASLSGTWTSHGGVLVITPSGTGVIAYRTYTWCQDSPHSPCDGILRNDIVPGGVSTFRLVSAGGSGSSRGSFTYSNTGLAGEMTARVRSNGTVSIPQFSDIPFCDGSSRSAGLCGA